MAEPGEDEMDQRLRWMKENVLGAYRAEHPQGHKHKGKVCTKRGPCHCTNSGTCIIVCSYMEGLGKVLKRGKGGNGERFNEFVKQCMNDFLIQTNEQSFAKRGVAFYGAFRSGFAHGYPTLDYKWGRNGAGQYWYQVNGKPTLNIDQFVAGFIDGVGRFGQIASVHTDLRTKFVEYITLEPTRGPRGNAGRK
jgi:hypothetical protein